MRKSTVVPLHRLAPRGKPRAGDRHGWHGDHDQLDARPGAVAGSTDVTRRTRSMPASRAVVSVPLRALGDFLYTLKAGPAGSTGDYLASPRKL
jgi:hypothetical protein